MHETIERSTGNIGDEFHDGNDRDFIERRGDDTRRTSGALHNDARGPYALKACGASPCSDRRPRIRAGVPRADEYAGAVRVISAASLARNRISGIRILGPWLRADLGDWASFVFLWLYGRSRQAQFGISHRWSRATGIAGAVDRRHRPRVAGDAADLNFAALSIGLDD